MLSFQSTIDLKAFETKYNRFQKELATEMRIALVNTREDFINRVASIVGSVPAEGGNIPSPYVAFYQPLSWKWLEIKQKRGYYRNIGTATGELLQWLIEFANSPTEVAMTEAFQEIGIRSSEFPDGIQEKVWMMESGQMTWGGRKIPARPIFFPVVAWYHTHDDLGTSPFYLEAIKARDRAIARVYGNT